SQDASATVSSGWAAGSAGRTASVASAASLPPSAASEPSTPPPTKPTTSEAPRTAATTDPGARCVSALTTGDTIFGHQPGATGTPSRREAHTATRTSATAPCWALTVRSTGGAPAASVRTVHVPGTAKNRNSPASFVGTSAADSPDESSNRTYAPPTHSPDRVTTPWMTDSRLRSRPAVDTPPAGAAQLNGVHP